eukprot:UN09141
MFKHAQNIAQFWFQHNQNNPQFWDKNFPDEFPFDDREESAVPVGNVTCYPYRTKVNHANSDYLRDPQVIEWSDRELGRILSNDLKQLNISTTKLKEITVRNGENESRKILKERALNKVNKEIEELTKTIKQKIKTSVYNTQSHQAGYTINVDDSIEKNW